MSRMNNTNLILVAAIVVLSIVLITITMFIIFTNNDLTNRTLFILPTPSPTPVPTPTPEPTPEPTPTPVPTPTPPPFALAPSTQDIQAEFDARIFVSDEDASVNTRNNPDDGTVVRRLDYGDRVLVEDVVAGDNGMWCKLSSQGSTYIAAWLLKFDLFRETALDLVSGEVKTNNLMELGTDNGIVIDIAFAGNNNVFNEKIYNADVCLLQSDAIEKLVLAQEKFKEMGYSIKVYDAYRPYVYTVDINALLDDDQKNLFGVPLEGSAHNRGAAVDITLVDSEGNEIDMPTIVHILDETKSSPSWSGMTAEQRANLDMMTEVMEEVGFVQSDAKWWLFELPNVEDYPVTNGDLRDFLN